jgi:hypothetical protein|tara:strand:- start:658 stop:1026 length:369 start_codon:yes stop_codon:yes gene_type:complete
MKKILQNKYGNGLNIKESPKTEAEREITLFIDTIETLEHIWHAEHELNNDYGVDLISFSQYYYHAIENLIIAKYGYNKADIIWWWVLDRFAEDGKLLGVEDKNGKVYTLKTPLDLWKFLQKL